MSRKMLAAAPILTFALVLSACNGDGGGTTASPTAGTTVPSPGPASPTGGAQEGEVSVVDIDFTPRELNVAVGGTVKWTWEGEMQHSVTADDGSFDSKVQSKGFEFEQTFTTPGRIEYYCQVHSTAEGSTQNGVIIVG